eukprot:1156432-Pelagomonas_calceolata.AAC.5
MQNTVMGNRQWVEGPLPAKISFAAAQTHAPGTLSTLFVCFIDVGTGAATYFTLGMGWASNVSTLSEQRLCICKGLTRLLEYNANDVLAGDSESANARVCACVLDNAPARAGLAAAAQLVHGPESGQQQVFARQPQGWTTMIGAEAAHDSHVVHALLELTQAAAPMQLCIARSNEARLEYMATAGWPRAQ